VTCWYDRSVHSNENPLGSVSSASFFMVLIAVVELVPGKRFALQLRGRIEIIARDAVGAGNVAEFHTLPSITMSPAAIAGAQPRQIGALLPERQVGLRGDVIGAAEQIEVVDVGRAEIGLDGFR